MRKNLYPGPFDGNDPGGGSGVAGVGDQARVVRGADQTEHEDTDDVEQEDTDPNAPNGPWDVLRRIVGFRGRHSEDLSTQKGIGSSDQDRPDTGETTESSRDFVVLSEGAGVVLHRPNSVIVSEGAGKLRERRTQ